MSLDEFKKVYGPAWVKVLQNPAFIAALQLLNIQKVNSIANLSDEHIANHSKEILGDLRGHFQHENDLMNLHKKQSFKLPLEEELEYISPEKEAEIRAILDRPEEVKKTNRK